MRVLRQSVSESGQRENEKFPDALDHVIRTFLKKIIHDELFKETFRWKKQFVLPMTASCIFNKSSLLFLESAVEVLDHCHGAMPLHSTQKHPLPLLCSPHVVVRCGEPSTQWWTTLYPDTTEACGAISIHKRLWFSRTDVSPATGKKKRASYVT